MPEQFNNHFLDRGEVLDATKRGSWSSLRLDIEDGLFPPGIKTSPRVVAWLASEVDAVNASIVRGDSDQERIKLVQQLINKRGKAR